MSRLQGTCGEKVQCTIPDVSLIDQLIELGYGNTRADVLSYLIRRALDDLYRSGMLVKPKKRDA